MFRIPLLLLFLLFPCVAHAHFGLLIPDRTMIFSNAPTQCQLDIAFAHPFSGVGMKMATPEEFFVVANGARHSLLNTLKPASYMNADAFTSSYSVERPGVYQFAIVPKPYFEEAEGSFIIHYVKTIIAAFGAEDGWEEPLGLPIEIIPLTRPFGNYAGNVFTGLVLKNGKPLANCPVEVENLNHPPRHQAPNPYFETQITRTDANGIFTWGIPWPGWWGFAALSERDEQLEKDGKPVNVEIGGVLWSRFDAPMAGK